MQLPLLLTVLVAVFFEHVAALGAAFPQVQLHLERAPGIRVTKVARQLDAPEYAERVKAGMFDNGVYVGDITLGPQSFRVQLDMGSSDLWLDHDGQSIEQLGGEPIRSTARSPPLWMSYALGTFIGIPIYGDVALGEHRSKKQAMLSVTQALDIDGLRRYGIHGILGLGFQAVAQMPRVLHEPVRSFLGNIFTQSPDAGSFTSWYLGRGGDGLLTINEIPAPFNRTVQSAPMLDIWTDPTTQTLPRWALELSGVEAAGEKVALPKSALLGVARGRAVAQLDFGAALSLVPESIADAIYSRVPGARYDALVKAWLVPCASEVSVAFIINGTRYAIDPLDAVSRPAELTLDETGRRVSVCIGAFLPASTYWHRDIPADFVLGDNFLRNVFTVMHHEKQAIQLLSITDEDEASKKFAAARNATLRDYAREADLSDPEVFGKVVAHLAGLPAIPQALRHRENYVRGAVSG